MIVEEFYHPIIDSILDGTLSSAPNSVGIRSIFDRDITNSRRNIYGLSHNHFRQMVLLSSFDQRLYLESQTENIYERNI